MCPYEWEDFWKRVQTFGWFLSIAFLVITSAVGIQEYTVGQHPVASVVAFMFAGLTFCIAMFAREYLKDLAWANQDRRDQYGADE
ncbi:hypothetical protein V7x_43780 [Crateriforma conspicua]|uniref:Uncharacterized protein n=1 Tax=Crateriforma conspicua TaxID=2527996 RepID=A0A5C6FQA5_9PLAN|nr:hypothetical protein [Crateriforma conspicua]TWU62643.1 hypothetical protein V7x_43780 [Crateriforma conspicua]